MSYGPWSLLPLGLPNMFGLTGQSMPKAMLEDVQLSLDILPFLAVPNANENLTATGNINSTGLKSFAASPGSTLIVPDGEAWLVRGYTCGADTLAGESLRMRPVIGRILGSGNIVQQIVGAEDTNSLTDAPALGSLRVGADKPFILWSGEFLGVNVSRITTAGAITLFGQASVFRFLV